MGAFRLLSRRLRRLSAPLLVPRPVDRVVPTELVEIPPGEQSGVMSVIEDNFDGILSNWLYSADTHILLAEHQDLLSRTMSFDFRRGRVHPQVLERQLEPAAICKTHCQQPGFAAYLDFRRHEVSHRSVSIRGACLTGCPAL
jgi:hypothetical protein